MDGKKRRAGVGVGEWESVSGRVTEWGYCRRSYVAVKGNWGARRVKNGNQGAEKWF